MIVPKSIGGSRQCAAVVLAAIIFAAAHGPASAQTTTNSNTSGSATNSASMPQSQKPQTPSEMTGDWGGLRTQLRDEGVDISSSFKNEAGAAVVGDAPHKAAQSGEFDLGATLDAQKLWGIIGGTLQTTITVREGAPPPGQLLQQSAEVFGRGNIARLTEFWYRQKLFDDLLTLKFGRIPQGEFNNFNCEFVNLTFCGAPGGNIVGNYWFNWPIAQWAAWALVKSGDFDFRTGVYEINPRDLDLNFAPGLFEGATGAMWRAEVGWSPKLGPDGLQGRYQSGVWYDTSGGPDVLIGEDGRPFVLTGMPALHRTGRYGYYIQAIQQITGTGLYDPGAYWKDAKGLSVFVNFIQADRATSVLDNQIAAGLFYAAPFEERPNDAVAIAFGRTNYNSRAADAIQLASPGAAVPRAEYPIEVYYAYQVQPWMTVRPDFQYIIHPGGFVHAENEVIIGTRTDLKF
jgi:porin